MLTLTLAATLAGWWVVRRYNGPNFHFLQLPMRFLSLRLAVGLTVMLLSSFIFIELGGELGSKETLSRVDRVFTEAIRDSVTTPVVHTFAVLTHFGDTATLVGLCIAMAVALVWRGRWWLTLGWVAAVAGNGVLNTALKHGFARARPRGLDGLALADGFSFPSGHSGAYGSGFRKR